MRESLSLLCIKSFPVFHDKFIPAGHGYTAVSSSFKEIQLRVKFKTDCNVIYLNIICKAMKKEEIYHSRFRSIFAVILQKNFVSFDRGNVIKIHNTNSFY